MSSNLEKFDNMERAGELSLKGWKAREIAIELDVSPVMANSLVKDYKEFLKARAERDPDFLERITENTLEMIDSMDLIIKEAWSVYEKAKEFEMLNMQTASLKLAMDTTERKAKLYNLMGAKSDGGSTARLAKAERVNEIVSDIIKKTIADCPRCREMAQIKLAEAFAIMGREEEAATRVEIVDEEVLELEAGDHYEVLEGDEEG